MPNTIQWIEEDEDGLDGPEHVREYALGHDGPSLFIVRTEPHGFFAVKTEVGPVPNKLNGKWTDLTMAEIAVTRYIAENVSSVKFKPKGEPAKVKSESETQKTANFKKAFKAKKEDTKH